MNILPINGRVAIVDDILDQAQPLMQELSKRRIPFEYYDGKPENFPDEETCPNDIRIVFLDLNLIDNQFHQTKQLYPIIFSSLDRLIRKNNYPYLLICWTRTDGQYQEIADKINEDFKENLPIAILPLPKLEYFELSGDKTSLYDEKVNGLFENIKNIMYDHTAFRNLIAWENHIHNATDKALNESLSVIKKDWDSSADWIFQQWGIAFAGKCKFKDYKTPIEKLKASYQTLNRFLYENIEEEIENEIDPNSEFKEGISNNGISLLKFNEKLLFSFYKTNSKEPGRIVMKDEEYSNYKDMLCYAINMNAEYAELKEELKNTSDLKEIKRIKNTFFSQKRNDIKNTWNLFKLVINPVCDYVQNKVKMSRVIPGIFIENKFRYLINDKTDALFVSPPFYYTEKDSEYFFILDFRYFTSEKEDGGESNLKLKQQVVAEVLSKLSRHINRQGILFIDE